MLKKYGIVNDISDWDHSSVDMLVGYWVKDVPYVWIGSNDYKECERLYVNPPPKIRKQLNRINCGWMSNYFKVWSADDIFPSNKRVNGKVWKPSEKTIKDKFVIIE